MKGKTVCEKKHLRMYLGDIKSGVQITTMKIKSYFELRKKLSRSGFAAQKR